MSADETSFVDCPECDGKETLTIRRWFNSREEMEAGFYSWDEKCSKCGYDKESYEYQEDEDAQI